LIRKIGLLHNQVSNKKGVFLLKAIDAGNNETKYYDGIKLRKFPSAIGLDYRARRLNQVHGDCDFEWEYAGRKGFAGTLAEESECAISQGGDSKAHLDAALRILISLHQFSNDTIHDIIVGQPIGRHTPEEKQAIKEMLTKRHDLTVNGEKKIIVIRRCEVAAEGVVAGLLSPTKGIVRVMDIGSATVNYGTIKDMRFVDRDSWTELIGMNSYTSSNYEAVGRKVGMTALKKWKQNDLVRVCGGGSMLLFDYIKSVFPNAEIIEDPIYANVKAFYQIARKVYG
jgi:plasmid segregation protein ParM